MLKSVLSTGSRSGCYFPPVAHVAGSTSCTAAGSWNIASSTVGGSLGLFSSTRMLRQGGNGMVQAMEAGQVDEASAGIPMSSRKGGYMYQSDTSTPDKRTVGSTNKKELETAMAKELTKKINLQGPIGMNIFMKDSLMDPQFGYYSTKKRVIGGAGSDFVTAPELPFFSEVIASWIVDVWQKMGTPRKVNLCELGPGKGTMMKKILQQIKWVQPQLMHFMDVHLVEQGQARRDEQKETLKEFQTHTGKIQWWMDVTSLPANAPMITICNEWFDALPVSQVAYTEKGWLEKCVVPCEDPKNEAHFKFQYAPGVSFVGMLIPDEVAKSPTLQIGDQIEMCIDGMMQAEKLAMKINDCGKGAVLIVDYGKDEHMSNTLKGIRGHKFVDPLLSPGDIDLSAWVSFKQLKWAVNRMDSLKGKVECRGPITQGDFLSLNGCDILLAMIIKDMDTKKAMKMISAYRRLTDDTEMGKHFKVMTMQTSNIKPVSPWFY